MKHKRGRKKKNINKVTFPVLHWRILITLYMISLFFNLLLTYGYFNPPFQKTYTSMTADIDRDIVCHSYRSGRICCNYDASIKQMYLNDTSIAYEIYSCDYVKAIQGEKFYGRSKGLTEKLVPLVYVSLS